MENAAPENDMSPGSTLRRIGWDLRRMLGLAWQMDRRMTAAYYLTAAVAALTPMMASLLARYLIDALVELQGRGAAQSIPLVVVFVLAARYAVNVSEEVFRWALNGVYYDYLFRYKLQNELSRRFCRKLAELDVQHLEDADTQTLIAKARDTFPWRAVDFVRMASYTTFGLVRWMAAFLVLLPFSWWMPLLVVLFGLPRLYIRTKFGSFQWSIYGSGAPQAKKLWYFGWLLTTPGSIKETRIFKSQELLLQKYHGIQDSLYALSKKPLDKFIRLLAVPVVLEVSLILTLALLKLPEVLSGALTVGSFTLFLSMLDQLNSATSQVVLSAGELHDNGLYVGYFFDVLGLPKLVREDPNPVSLPPGKPPRIEFRGVSFSYPNGPAVLRDVSFVIEPGQNAALVGSNGAGKSTIVKLLCRFYDVSAGEILVNGVNLKRLKLSDWYDYLGTLFQEFVQFHFSVRENIMLGRPGSVDEARMRHAAEMSGAAEFIGELPGKYDQMLGRDFEEGTELSTGQWQKLAIARAFYQQPPVLIMDEPTSAVDAEAEYEIFNNLERVYRDKTIVFVSHRFSSVRNAEKIIVVEGGCITEQGSHEELLAKNGKYARMFLTQAKGYAV